MSSVQIDILHFLCLEKSFILSILSQIDTLCPEGFDHQQDDHNCNKTSGHGLWSPAALLDVFTCRGNPNFKDNISCTAAPWNDPLCTGVCEYMTTVVPHTETKVSVSDVCSYRRRYSLALQGEEPKHLLVLFWLLLYIYLFITREKVHVFYTELICLVLSFYVLSS